MGKPPKPPKPGRKYSMLASAGQYVSRIADQITIDEKPPDQPGQNYQMLALAGKFGLWISDCDIVGGDQKNYSLSILSGWHVSRIADIVTIDSQPPKPIQNYRMSILAGRFGLWISDCDIVGESQKNYPMPVLAGWYVSRIADHVTVDGGPVGKNYKLPILTGKATLWISDCDIVG